MWQKLFEQLLQLARALLLPSKIACRGDDLLFDGLRLDGWFVLELDGY